MGVGSGLYMYDVVVKRSRSLSHLLMSSCLWIGFNETKKGQTSSVHYIGSTSEEIGHLLVNTRWSILYRSFEFDTDHLPVIAILAIRLKCTMKKRTSLHASIPV